MRITGTGIEGDDFFLAPGIQDIMHVKEGAK